MWAKKKKSWKLVSCSDASWKSSVHKESDLFIWEAENTCEQLKALSLKWQKAKKQGQNKMNKLNKND